MSSVISPKLTPSATPSAATNPARAPSAAPKTSCAGNFGIRPVLKQAYKALHRTESAKPRPSLPARLNQQWQTFKPIFADPDYRALFRAKCCNQIGTGVALGSYIMLLQQVGLATVGQGLLAFWALGYLESMVLALGVSPHSGSLRDAYNRREGPAHDPKSPEAKKLRSEVASLLWACEFINTGITLTTLAAIGSVYAGLLGGAPLFLALAVLQVARASITTYQHSFTNALKPMISDDKVRDAVMRDHQYVFNSVEMGFGRVVLMSSVAGLVQVCVPMLPVSYVLPTLAGLMVSSSLITAYGKLPLIDYIKGEAPKAETKAPRSEQTSPSFVPAMPHGLEGAPSLA